MCVGGGGGLASRKMTTCLQWQDNGQLGWTWGLAMKIPAGVWVEESGFCLFPEGVVLIFLNVFLWARAEENANGSK